jgi:hypothetical protein
LSLEISFACLKKDGCTWYSRRAGVKPPPDRAKRSIFIFSLKNPLRQLFIQVPVMNDEGVITHGRIIQLATEPAVMMRAELHMGE